MALAKTGSIIQNNEKNSASSTLVLTVATGNLPASGELLVVCVALDNLFTGSDGDEGLITNITDSRSNTYTKVAEFSNTQGASAGGALCAIFYSVITTSLQNADTISINLGAPVQSKAAQAWRHTRDTSKTITVVGFQTNAWDGVNVPATTALTLTNGTEYAVVHAMANELANASSYTAATNYTAWAASTYGTTGGGGASNMCISVEERIASTLTSEAPDASVTASDGAGIITAFYEVASSAFGFPFTRNDRMHIAPRRDFDPWSFSGWNG